MKQVVVLGGSGFLGSYVVEMLAARGTRVLVPTRHRERAKHLILLPTVDVVDANIHDQKTLNQLCVDATAVINLVGILHEARRDDFRRVHVDLPRKIIAACRANSISRLLHASALSAKLDGPSAYLRTKGEGANLVAESGLQWTVFEPSVIFGREDRLLNQFAKLQKYLLIIPLGGAKARFHPIFVEDVALAMLRSIHEDATFARRYQLCGPKVYTLAELFRYAGELAGHRRPLIELSNTMARFQAAVLEHLPGKLLSRDNLDSMQVDSVCGGPFPAVFGFQPTALEAVAPSYVGPAAMLNREAQVRIQHG